MSDTGTCRPWYSVRRRSVPAASVTVVAGLSAVLLVAAGAAASVRPTETGGWRAAVEVPRTAFLNKGGSAEVYSVSCAAGTCLADGGYTDRSGHFQAFVVTEAKGRWGKAVEAPGTAALDKGRTTTIGSVSCAAPGSCAAGGGYTDGAGHYQAFVVTQAKGRWGRAIEVPGLAALNRGGFAQIQSVSCMSATSCVAGGTYEDGSGHFEAFVVGRQ
jgi:hypothetical protein